VGIFLPVITRLVLVMTGSVNVIASPKAGVSFAYFNRPSVRNKIL